MKPEKEKYAERFADYMIEALERTGKRKADIARLAALSRTTISQIVGKKPNSTTGKLILPERETVDRIANAFGDPVAKARRAAGYDPAGNHHADTVEEALDESFFDYKGLSEDDKAKLRPILEMLDREIARLRNSPAPQKLARAAMNTTTVLLQLQIKNDEGFTSAENRARTAVEKVHLKQFRMNKVKGDEYELTFSHQEEVDLDEQIYTLLREIKIEVKRRKCSMLANVREKDGDRYW